MLGTPQECVERLQRFADAGVHHFILSPLCDDEKLGQHLKSMRGRSSPSFAKAMEPQMDADKCRYE